MRTVYLGIGSNLGDRQGNILAALQRLRVRLSVQALSSFYETPPASGVAGPAFLNVAAKAETALEPADLERFARQVEIAVGRQNVERLAARPIDIDVIFGSDGVGAALDLATRPFNLVPLAEIAPDLIDPTSRISLAELMQRVDTTGIVRKTRALHFDANRQEEEPAIRLSIDRAGVAAVKRVVRLNLDGKETVFNAEFAMVADLAPGKAGLHMSRFAELLEEVLLDILADERQPARIEDLTGRIARRIVATQKAVRADVRLRAEFGLERWTPVSGKRGEETYTLVGIAHAERDVVRRAVGIEGEGMTACPCAQGMIREHSERELQAAGFSPEDARRALGALPVATHNQRGRGAIVLGVEDGRAGEVRAEELVEIVENAMSSETYDLLKRPDEFFVVNKAHHNPKFVEDVVRGILAGALDVYGDFSDSTFVSATQVNYESIHKHDAYAEAFGTFAEFRAELRTGTAAARKTDLATWLGTRPSAVVA